MTPHPGEPESSRSGVDLQVLYPHLHILVVGANESGKSSLIKHSLGVDSEPAVFAMPEVAGWSQASGISTTHQPRFIFHEISYDPKAALGDPTNLSNIQAIINTILEEQPLESHIHAIWFCTQVPYGNDLGPGLLPLELGFLNHWQQKIQIPVMTIFTQFDLAVDSAQALEVLRMSNNVSDNASANNSSHQQAEDMYHESCVEVLKRSNPNIPYLRVEGLNTQEPLSPQSQSDLDSWLQLTHQLAEGYIEKMRRKSLQERLASVPAQLETSMQTGMNGPSALNRVTQMNKYRTVYYSALLSIILWNRLDTILAKSHRRLTRGWNLDDPHVKRDSPTFVSEVRQIAGAPSTDHSESKAPGSGGFERYQLVFSLVCGVYVSARYGLIAVGVAAALWIIRVFFQLRKHLPETARHFLEYTIHLTLLLDRIFLHSMNPSTGRPHPLTDADIRQVLDEYQASEAAAQVRSEVQLFVDDATESIWKTIRGLRKGRARELVREMVERWKMRSESTPMRLEVARV